MCSLHTNALSAAHSTTMHASGFVALDYWPSLQFPGCTTASHGQPVCLHLVRLKTCSEPYLRNPHAHRGANCCLYLVMLRSKPVFVFVFHVLIVLPALFCTVNKPAPVNSSCLTPCVCNRISHQILMQQENSGIITR